MGLECTIAYALSGRITACLGSWEHLPKVAMMQNDPFSCEDCGASIKPMALKNLHDVSET